MESYFLYILIVHIFSSIDIVILFYKFSQSLTEDLGQTQYDIKKKVGVDG